MACMYRREKETAIEMRRKKIEATQPVVPAPHFRSSGHEN